MQFGSPTGTGTGSMWTDTNTYGAVGSIVGTVMGLAGSGGSGGGGGGSGYAPWAPLSPDASLIGSMFGQQYYPQIGWLGNPYDPNGIFGNARGMLGNYLNQAPVGLNQFQTGIPQSLLQQAYGAEQGKGGPLAAILPEAKSLAQGNIDPIIQAAQRQFSTYGLPQIAQQFAGTTGVNSSDFGAQAIRTAGDISTNLGAQSIQTALAGIPEYAAAQQANVAIPTNLASDITQYGSGLQGALQALQNLPGQRVLNTISQLGGMGEQLPYTQQGFSPFGSGTAATLGALGQAFGQSGQGLANLGIQGYNYLTGGNNNNPMNMGYSPQSTTLFPAGSSAATLTGTPVDNQYGISPYAGYVG